MSNVPNVTRRETLVLGTAVLSTIFGPAGWAGQNLECHGISAFGDLKYPADFKQFDYVNANAPKGGSIFACRVVAALQSEQPHIQLTQQLYPQRRRCPRHGAHLRKPDGARAGRA